MSYRYWLFILCLPAWVFSQEIPKLDQTSEPSLPKAPEGSAPEFSPEMFEALLNDLFKDLDLSDLEKPKKETAAPQLLSETVSEDDQVGNITFSDENPSQVIALIQNLTGKPVLIQQGLPNNKITFSTNKAMSRVEAVIALESVLAMNGIAISPLGEHFLRALPTGSAGAQAPAFLPGFAHELAPSTKIYSKFFALHYLIVPEAIPLIQPLMTPNLATLIPFEKQHQILVTDTLVNLQHMEAILMHVDKPAAKREKVVFYQMKNAAASKIQKDLTQLIDNGLKNRLYGRPFINADDRTNQLLMITHEANLSELEQIIQGLDADATSFTHSKAYALKHAEAPKVVEIIKEIIGGQKQVRDKDKSNDISLKNNKKEASTASNADFSDSVTVVADERGNLIIAYGTPSDIKQIDRLVDEMDRILPQVRIEVIIAEVTLTDGSQRGIDTFGLQYDETGPGSTVAVSGGTFDAKADSFVSAAAGVPLFFSGKLTNQGFNLKSVFQTAQNNSNVRILSAPTIVTSHNKEASIEIGQQQPIITGTITDTASTVTNSDGTANTAVKSTVEYKDISILLKVKPLIGPNGVIQMEIDQSINSVVDETTINGVKQPIIGKRQAVSFVSALDQEVIVLGGLRQNEIRDSKGKVFLLGDLPIIGDALFTSKTKTNTIKELVMFIRPHIITQPTAASRNPKTVNDETYQMIDLSANRDDLIEFLGEGRFPDVPLTDFDRPLSTIIDDPKIKKEGPTVPKSQIGSAIHGEYPLRESIKDDEATGATPLEKNAKVEEKREH